MIFYLFTGANSGEPDMTMQPMVPEEGDGCPGNRMDAIVRTGDGRTFSFEGKGCTCSTESRLI